MFIEMTQKRTHSHLSSLPHSDIFLGLAFGVFTRCRTTMEENELGVN